jgi:hypothetical protein
MMKSELLLAGAAEFSPGLRDLAFVPSGRKALRVHNYLAIEPARPQS